MKKLLLLLIVTFTFTGTRAQFIHKIKADSVLITNDSCNAELNLENSTRNVKGFLYNKGNGRTEFRKAEKLNDSTLVLGEDTIALTPKDMFYPYLAVKDGKVGVQTVSPSTPFEVKAAMSRSESIPVGPELRSYVNLAGGQSPNSHAGKGGFYIILPDNADATFASIELDVNDATAGASKILIGWGNHGPNASITFEGPMSYNPPLVRMGGGPGVTNGYIVIGDSSHTWDFAIVKISRLFLYAGFSLPRYASYDTVKVRFTTSPVTLFNSVATTFAYSPTIYAHGTYSGTANTRLGYKAGNSLTTGNSNVLLGYQSGDNLTTGTNNIIIGSSIDAQSAGGTGQLSIGNLIYGTGLGATGTTVSTGNIGIAVNNPQARFHVSGSGKFDSVLTTAGRRAARRSIATATTLTNEDEYIFGDASGGAFTVTLPSAIARDGQLYTIKKKDNSSNAITVNTTASQTIDGNATYSLLNQWDFVTVIAEGGSWLIVNK